MNVDTKLSNPEIIATQAMSGAAVSL